MERENNLVILYDYYGELLTDSQKQYFEDYYFNNLTLSEIADNYNVSRNAVHKQIKASEEKLYFYENTLKLYKKNEEVRKILENDKKLCDEIMNILEGE